MSRLRNSTIKINNYQKNCIFNPFDKVLELYERLVLAEKEKAALLEKLLSEKIIFRKIYL